jgi:hypothetical protein
MRDPSQNRRSLPSFNSQCPILITEYKRIHGQCYNNIAKEHKYMWCRSNVYGECNYSKMISRGESSLILT